MRLRRSLTLVEIVIVLIVIGVLACAAIASYFSYIEKAKSAEAIINVGSIRAAEEMYKLDKGTYVAADDTQAVNERLGMDIAPKYYEYKVIDAGEDNFLAIAKRIGVNIDAYITSGKAPPEHVLIVMDKTGIIRGGSEQYFGTSGGGGGGSSGGGSGGSSGGGSGGSSGGGSGGSSGGGSGGSSGGGSGGSSGGGSGGGDGGTSGSVLRRDVDLQAALTLLKDSTSGQYYGDLIELKEISIIFDDFSLYPGAENAAAFWWGTVRNTIYINESLKSTAPDSAIAALLAHEATHADYDYNSQKWIDSTLAKYPQLTVDDLHITVSPGDSIDQEYNAFSSQMEVWKEIKGADTDSNNDGWEQIYDQGESFMKTQIRFAYSDQNLPEY